MTQAKLSHRVKSWATALAIAGSLTVAACAPDGGPPAPTPIGGTVSVPAPIHEVSLIESAVKPGTWSLRVQYGLPGGCASPGGYVLSESFPHQIRVNILMPKDPSRACTMIYSYGTYEIELGGGYQACQSYEIRVNGEPHNVKAISPLATCPAGGQLSRSCPSGSCGAPRETSGNPLLTELALEDQEARRGGSPARSDLERLRLVIGEIGAGRVHTNGDRKNAALVLQHSPITFRDDDLVAISPHDYLLAHHFAKAAFEAGDSTARPLVAQTIDRFLSLTEGYQKYGTNRFINQATGQEELAFIDRATTDAERATYGVAPLADLLRQFPEAHRKQIP